MTATQTPDPPDPADPPGSPRRRPRRGLPRSVWIGGAVVAGVAAGLVALALVVDTVDDMLPTGSRTSIYGGMPSNEQGDVGPYWYTREEAEALSAELEAAVDGSDWCVGWSIVLTGDTSFVSPATPGDTYRDDPSNDPLDDPLGSPLDDPLGGSGIDVEGGYSSTSIYDERADVGSNRGPGRSARNCASWAEVEVVYEYTSSTSSLEDNAQFAVAASDLEVERALRDHPALQVSSDALLHEDRGENTDDVIGNAIAALPLALAEVGVVDPLSVEPVEAGTEGAVTFEDREGEGGIDLLVANRTMLLAGGLTVLLGLTALCMALGRVPAQWFPAPAPPGRRNPRRLLKAHMQRAHPPGGSS